MELGLITHRADGSECYAIDDEHLEISIRTGYEVDKVFICYGDPFSDGIMGGSETWSGEKKELITMRRCFSQKLWSIILKPQFRRCKYYFEIHAKDEVVCYFEDGCYSAQRMSIQGRKEQCFFFPWLNPSDVNHTPQWVEDTIWYQIFPDRFCNGDASRNSKYVKPWKSEEVQYLDIYGGDLRGIRSRVPYLRDLGITGIYLTPIFASDSNHKYNTTDYYNIDEAFGDEEELKMLVKEVHEAGIHIMLDAVFNHCGFSFAPWQDVLANGEKSEYFEWFFVHQFPFDRNNYNTRDGRYDAFAFHGEMPKLNTNNPKVIEYFIKLCSYWLEKWNIDGIRFDVGNEVSHTFLKELRKAVKSINPEVYLLGEIWHDALPWLKGDEYDSVMNYPLTQSMNDFFIDESRSAIDFEFGINRCYSLYYKQTNRVLFNMLDSHDTERLIYRTKSIEKFYQQLAILFTMEGTPCIYYGTEIAMPGGFDPDCRRCMPWEDIENRKYKDRIIAMKQLIQMRKNHSACKSDQIVWLQEADNPRVIHYQKLTNDGQCIEVIVNASNKKVKIPTGKKILFTFGCNSDEIESDGVYVVEK